MELWDSAKTEKKAIEFCANLDNKPRKPYDDYLIPYQLKLSKVYSSELYRLGYINSKEYKIIQSSLKKLNNETLSVVGYEDVHSLLESKLHESSGDIVGSVHLGLSRNDQIITLMRMWMRDQILTASKDLESLISTLKKEIKKKGNLSFIGYSHHRIAMPTTYGEMLKSYLTSLKRDENSLKFWIGQYNECPLGVAGGFGSPVKIDRYKLAKKLGFDRPTESTIDTVTTRWEAEVELADRIKVIMNHLSTIAQDFIINSMDGINILYLPKEYCTGSSIFPQKLNPDVLETIKSKALDIEGETFKLSSVGRGNISGYNRDTQKTKYWIMNIFSEFSGCLDIISDIITGVRIDERRVKQLLKKGGAYAAEEVIRKSLSENEPYRTIKLKEEKRIKRK